MKGCLYKLGILAGVLVLLLLLFFLGYLAVPLWGWGSTDERFGQPIALPPSWALECWVWEDDVNTRAFVEELLAGYKEHDFPVRTILIDSPWTMRYNDFEVDTERYPNPEEFFGQLEEDGYRVVLWMTPNVNSANKDTAIQDSTVWYEAAREAGYLLNDGAESRWWKGKGGYIDYTNPDAVNWWRDMQQPLFDWGIDGWKLDGSATLSFTWLGGRFPVPWLSAHAGTISTRAYMDHYYRDEYLHGLTQNPEFITLARSIDDGDVPVHRRGFAPFDAAPITWVGDQDHNWVVEEEGIQEALRDILRAAESGYGAIGSDIGGYSGGEIPADLYIRWAQFSTFCGLFLNGGHGERRMWLRSQDELEIIREFSWLHTELVPYIYSALAHQHDGGPTLMQPYGEHFEYRFGDAFFIAPYFEDLPGRACTLPEGTWRYWFDDTETIEGGTTIDREYPMDEFPVFVEDGSIIPMRIERAYTGIGDETWKDYIAFNVYPAGGAATRYRHLDSTRETSVQVVVEEDAMEITLEGDRLPHLLRLHCDDTPTSVERDGQALPDDRWSYDAEARKLIVRTKDAREGTYPEEGSLYRIRF